jgi:hypothetical protein
MVQQLLPKVGFPWTMRALGFIQLGCLVICNVGIKPRVPPRKTGALVDWASFREASYVLFAAGMFFVGISLCPRSSLLSRPLCSALLLSVPTLQSLSPLSFLHNHLPQLTD